MSRGRQTTVGTLDPIIRDSRKSWQKIEKNMANFYENLQNHGKITALNYEPKND